MIDLIGKVVDECGWAGPLLWVSTTDGISIHLYDETIELDGRDVPVGEDVNKALAGLSIIKFNPDGDWLSITFSSGASLRIRSKSHETARVFWRNREDPHLVYKNGFYGEDGDRGA